MGGNDGTTWHSGRPAVVLGGRRASRRSSDGRAVLSPRGVGVAVPDRAGVRRVARQLLTVAQRLGVNRATVRKWRGRFVQHRLDGLLDEPRPGAPRAIGDDDVERSDRRNLGADPG